MRIVIAIVSCVLLFCLLNSIALAQQQQPPQGLPTDPAQVAALLERTGCNAQVNAASQTIAQQQQKINELQKQLQAKDPKPKGGATEH